MASQIMALVLLGKTLDHLRPGIWSGQTVQSYIVEIIQITSLCAILFNETGGVRGPPDWLKEVVNDQFKPESWSNLVIQRKFKTVTRFPVSNLRKDHDLEFVDFGLLPLAHVF